MSGPRRPPADHPPLRLRSGARPVRRSVDQVQFGLTPENGIVIGGLTESESALLLALPDVVTPRHLAGLARRQAVRPSRLDELLAILRAHDLLVDDRPGPAAAAAAARRTVCVLGAGPVADRLCEHLARTVPGQLTRELAEGSPDVLVRVAAPVIPLVEEWRPGVPDGVARLPVLVRPDGVTIGPLLQGGRGPCLWCLELHRRDRDSDWPRVLAQVAGTDGGTGAAAGSDAGLAEAAGALTALVVRAHLDGHPARTGTTWQLAPPWPDVLVRRWARHPGCPCAVTAWDEASLS